MFSKNSLESTLAKCKNPKQNTNKKQRNRNRLRLSNGKREKLRKQKNVRSKKKLICQARRSKNFKELEKLSRKNSKATNTTKNEISKKLSNYIQQQLKLILVNFFTTPIWQLFSSNKKSTTKRLNSVILRFQRLERAHTISSNSLKLLLARLLLLKKMASFRMRLILMLRHYSKTTIQQ